MTMISLNLNPSIPLTSRDFCYWLQGHFEISNPTGTGDLTPTQVIVIRNHLALVFKHEIDPSIDHGDPSLATVLQEIHDGKPNPLRPPSIPSNQNGPIYRC